MKMTVDFYVGVLGMQLVHAMKVPPGLGSGPGNRGNPPFERFAIISSTWDATACSRSSRCPRAPSRRRPQRARRHAARVVRGLAESQARIRARLEAHKVPYDGPLEILPGIFSIYVLDPNDIRLELSCQPGNGEGEPASCRR